MITAIDAIRSQRALDSTYDLLLDGRMTLHEYTKYWHAWTWSAPRYSGPAGMLQDAYYKRHGGDALQARFERVCAVLATIV